MKYVFIGPYPPPLGGVSVYIYRFSKMLRQEGNNVEVLDLSKRCKILRLIYLLKLMLTPEKTVFHLHCVDFYSMAALLLRPFGKRVIFHDHSWRFYDKLSRFKKSIFRCFLKKTDECMLDGPHLAANYEPNGLVLPQNTYARSPFLPPPLEDEPEIIKTYSKETIKFVENHQPLVVANGFQISFLQGIDLYGLDMCVELTGMFKKTYPNIGFLFALAEIGDAEYYKKMNLKINELGIQNNFHFMTGQKELWPLFRKAKLMIRPTCSDGYGISIAEAIYFGCPAVASDVCERHPEAILFKNRDLQDLYEKVHSVL